MSKDKAQIALVDIPLPTVFSSESEEVELPDEVTNIEQLLTLLRGSHWGLIMGQHLIVTSRVESYTHAPMHRMR